MSNVLPFPSRDEPDHEDDVRLGDGDGDGTILVHVHLHLSDDADYDDREPDPEPPKERRWPAFLAGAMLGWWLG